MRLIEENPFRVLGLPVDASEKEIVKRVSDLEIFVEMGKEKKYDSDLDFIAPIDRTPELIKEARQKIEQPKNKFYQTLWWFWPNNSVDELAIDVLQDGNYKKALSLWYDAIEGEDPDRNNISNYKNLGLLALWLSVKGDKISKDTFKNGLKFTGQFMGSEAFKSYQSSILNEYSLYELYRIKTLRNHKVYVDNFGQYYASWKDFWHVFNNLESSGDKHWSIYKPKFIHRDHKRFILKELSQFKASTKAENWDVYLESWNKWEDLLYDGEKALEVDLSETPISEDLRYVGFHYNRFATVEGLIDYVEGNYLSNFMSSPVYNTNWIFTNTYSGQKVVSEDETTLEDAQILPGSILLVELKE